MMVCKTYFENPSQEQIQNCKNELGEDDERFKHTEDLVHKWIQCQEHFPKNYDKNIVKNFLRGTKHNMEKTKQKLETHFIARHEFSEIFSNRNPSSEEIQRVIDNVNIVVLPKLTENGERVSVFSLENPDVSELDMVNSIRLFLMIYDLVLTSDLPVCSEILIMDGRDFSPSHFAKFICPTFKNLMSLTKQAYAIRIKQIHIINAPSIIEALLSVVRPLIHEKVRNRFIIHKDNESLLDYFSKDVLPKDYGGNTKSIRELMTDLNKILMENCEWFKKQENIKIVSKVKKCGFEKQIGMEGSFRKLTID